MLMIQFLIYLLAITNKAQSQKHGESTIASAKEVPYMVSFLYEGTHYCSGIYIRPQWILTTAHCIKPSKMSKTTIRIGDENSSFEGKISHAAGHSLTIRPKPGETVPANVSTETLNNIGLVQLSKPFTIGPSVAMAQLISGNIDYKGATARMVGFGKLCSKDQHSNSPRIVDITLQKSDGFLLYPNWAKSAAGFCKGDSGSAVTLNSQIIGIVVCGYNCGPRKVILSNAILELNRHLKWIDGKIEDINISKSESHCCNLSIALYIILCVVIFFAINEETV